MITDIICIIQPFVFCSFGSVSFNLQVSLPLFFFFTDWMFSFHLSSLLFQLLLWIFMSPILGVKKFLSESSVTPVTSTNTNLNGLSSRVPSEGLDNMNAALHTFHTGTITEFNRLIYSMKKQQ